MEIAAIAGLTVAAAFLAVVLRQHKPEFALAVGLMAGIVILAVCLRKAAPALGSLSDLLNAASLPAEYGAALFKALGVCLLTQLASDACSDAGEKALAGRVELAARVTLFAMAAPLLTEVVTAVTGALA